MWELVMYVQMCGARITFSCVIYIVSHTWLGNFVRLRYYGHNVDMLWIMLINLIFVNWFSAVPELQVMLLLLLLTVSNCIDTIWRHIRRYGLG